MKTIFHLSTCSTCQRILKEWNAPSAFKLQDIKTDKMLAEQVDEMIKLAGSAEKLFSKRAVKYRTLGLHEKQLTEKDYRQLIMEEYTFLSRPVLVDGNKIFIGNSKNVVAAAAAHLKGQ